MTPKMIIVEGADSTGKTSLAKFIARRLGMVYLHASGHKTLHPGMLAYHLELIRSAEFNILLGRGVVFDRLWPSEWCYGRILRSHISEHYLYDRVWDALRIYDPAYIFCFSDKAHERHEANHEDQDHRYCVSEYAQIYGEYKHLCSDMQLGSKMQLGEAAAERGISSKILTYSIESNGAMMAEFCDRNLL